jgi:hypothetical protein
MQGEQPLRQIDRQLVMPKGWLQVSLSVDQKNSTSYRDANGVLTDRSGGTVWTYRRAWLRIEQGFSPRMTLYAHVPLVQSTLQNDSNVELRTRALGDVHTGLRYQPWTGTRHKLAFGVDLKAPSGVEWPSDLIGGASNTSSFLTGTGVTNLNPEVHGRVMVRSFAVVDAHLGYVHKFPAVVGYVLETDGFGNGWLNPGNEVYARGSLLCQISDRMSIHGDLKYSRRAAHRIGVSGQSTSSVELETLKGSEAEYTDAGGGLSFSASEHMEITIGAIAQVGGTDTRTFAHLGLEELSPQPGIESNVEVMLRW